MVLPWNAQQLIEEVDRIFDRAGLQTDLQAQSDYAKYLVVRISGLVEQVMTEIVTTFVSTQSSTPVTRHVLWRMGAFQNPSLERILRLVGSFDSTWRVRLEEVITQAEREALGSINSQRNRVAHGETSTISLSQVRGYYDQLKELLEKVAAVF